MTQSSARLIILDPPRLGRTVKRPHLIHCKQCEGKFKIGDEIITKKGKNVTRWYHRKCAEGLNIWWSET